MTSDSGDAAGGTGGGGERRRITRAYYASEGTRPQPGYGQGYDQGYGQQESGQQGYGHDYGQQQGHGQPPGPVPGFGGYQPTSRQGGGAGGRRRRKGLLAIAAGACLVILAAVGFILFKPGGNSAGFHPTAGTPSGDAQQITTAFLQAWDGGDLAEAAGLTDNPVAARAALTAYAKDLNLKKLSGSVGSAAQTSAPAAPAPKPTSGAAASTTLQKVTFQLNAVVSSPSGSGARPLSGTWSYHSHLVAYQAHNSDGWFIQWKPDVVAPNLTASQHLAAVSVAPQVVSVTDSGGGQLTSYNDPGLNTISGLLQKTAPEGKGSPGLSVQIENAKGKAIPNRQAVVVSPTNIGELATTIDPRAENAAMSAVKAKTGSSLVAIQPSTGHILAIANNAGFNDFALTAAVAPGSSMKIITSTALFNSGTISASTPVSCPVTYQVQGITYHNDQNESEPSSTPFSYDFAQSCNNAFTQWWPRLSGKLASTAKDYYGLNQDWDIGITGDSASFFNAPASASGSELAQEAFGEGQLKACPLAMASVAATVSSGRFRQPVLVSGTKTVSASPLPSSTDSQLKEIMRDVVTEGTGAGIGFNGTVYAKTGTADIQGQQQPNSWLVAFDPSRDIAVADLVVNAGYGAQIAGPEVKSFLDKY